MAGNKKSVGGSVFWAYVDRISAQGVSAIISIILARLIDPEHYGIIAMATILVQFMDVFVNPGFSSALVQRKNPDELDYSTMCWFNIVLSFVLYLIIFILAPFVERFYEIEMLTLLIRVLALNLPFAAVISVQKAYMHKNLLFKRYFFVSFFGTTTAGTVAIIMANMGFGVWALVVYSLAKCVMDCVLSFFIIRWRPRLMASVSRFREMFGFGRKVFGVTLLDVAYSEINSLIIGKKYTTADLACYQRGQFYPRLLVNNVISSITEVMFPVLSNMQDNKQRMLDTMRKTIKACDYLLFPMMFGLFACADSFVVALLTEMWIESVPFLRIMCLYQLAIPISSIIYQGIKASGQASLLLKIEIIKKIYCVGVVVVAVFVFDTPLAVSWAVLFSAYTSTIINLVVARRFLGMSIRQYIKDVIPVFLISAVMVVAVLAVKLLGLSAVPTLLIQVILGAAVYFALSVVFRISQMRDAIDMIKSKFKAVKK